MPPAKAVDDNISAVHRIAAPPLLPMPVYVQTPSVTLPYPGLRPFRRDEHEIFFGRKEHVERLADMLQRNHFIAVVGPSGCGKSSLVTAGLLPQLAEGHALPESGQWYEVTIRPGDRPFARLAEAIVDCGMLPSDPDADLESRIGFLDAFLRRGPLGLIESIEKLTPLNGANLLIVVDQFEEIFRYRHEGGNQEADAFVAMLLESVRQAQLRGMPIYIMLTMRSDYIGDCNQFSGLPEEISNSQFLTPRPNREQRHAAIVGPAAMFGGEVEPALVNRLLNDMGDDPDQLPIMQHALMRMWSLRGSSETDADNAGDSPPLLTTELYEEVGGWRNTLSQHADEAFLELGANSTNQRTAEIMFRCLTQPGSEQNDVRRPVSVMEVAEAAGVSTELVKNVAAVFRRSDRSLITPALAEGDTSGSDLSDEDILDISHESLIRQWQRLRDWTEDEAGSAATYRRLEDVARRWKAGLEAFLQSPGLDIALKWKQTDQPTAAWARRYGSEFDLAMEFLSKSEADRHRKDEADEARRSELAAQRARADQHEKNVSRVRRFVAITGMMALLFAGSTLWAFYQWRKANLNIKAARESEKNAFATVESFKEEIKKLKIERDRQQSKDLLGVKEQLTKQNEAFEQELPQLKKETDESKIAAQLFDLIPK